MSDGTTRKLTALATCVLCRQPDAHPDGSGARSDANRTALLTRWGRDGLDEARNERSSRITELKPAKSELADEGYDLD